ncbi:hypothetical protein CCHR01_08495 [Colletotrichum chrysophilum]|uniref:Uncharacterized protein n=1 Tax=Colletotrichum chrysophilum TaxID=1836956 RepID=A0AAD9AIS4_9PEZI|nr:hypothetical protein CCHR01_08495 [Colletotrichum chrysophilum]
MEGHDTSPAGVHGVRLRVPQVELVRFLGSLRLASSAPRMHHSQAGGGHVMDGRWAPANPSLEATVPSLRQRHSFLEPDPSKSSRLPQLHTIFSSSVAGKLPSCRLLLPERQPFSSFPNPFVINCSSTSTSKDTPPYKRLPQLSSCLTT